MNGSSAGVRTAQVAQRLGGAVLLAGGMNVPPMSRAAGRSLLDLHLTPTRSVLGLWLDRLGRFAGEGGVRVLCGGDAPTPEGVEADVREKMSIERERRDLRGPGGALADACVDLASDQSVLAVEAVRVFIGELDRAVDDHFEQGADITILAGRDMSPAGVSIVRRGVLDLVPKAGFMDLKEQLLDRAITRGFVVRVFRLEEERSMPVRTREQFLDAARAAAGLGGSTRRVRTSRVEGDGSPPLRVIGEGAVVEEGARVIESVVTPGAVVRSGALVVRSVVAPGAIVEPGMEVVDAVVSTAGTMSDARANARDRRGMVR
jgi:NDP-sugar pyrophosphorylase family protein